MTLLEVVLGIHVLFCIALLFQCFEMLAISRKKEFLTIWSFENLQKELPLKYFFKKIYSKNGFRILLAFQIFLIVASLIWPGRIFILSISIIQLLICIRFRGLFNGGSDMMVFVIATGLLIGGKFGIIYIAIHTIYSYFKAGIAKIRQPTWRSGIALGQLLETSLFASYKNFAIKLQKKRKISAFLSYIVLAFELSVPLVFLSPNIASAYCVTAIIFHGLNCGFFGLNRFLWIWMAAWPSVLYCAELIKF